MTDPRHVEARCEAAFVIDALRLREFRCEFRDGHDGLHYSWPDQQPGGEAPMRWGHQHRVSDEVLICNARAEAACCAACGKPMAAHGPMANCR